ncbi:hypothetical protein HOH87_00085 [bacterium]|jgi:hypothetical protein|nr:hypothetical protein [bacterium]
MKKFTLYQAARYSKISRYKLEQAITEGLLTTITGKGNIKCFIYENELNRFIEEHGDQYTKPTYQDELKPFISSEINNFVSKDLHEEILADKNRIIEMLEFQNQKLIPLIPEEEKLNLAKERGVSGKIEFLRSFAEKVISKVDQEDTRISLREELNLL